MEIAVVGGTDKRFLAVLVVVPTTLGSYVVAEINGEARQRLMVVVLQGTKRLEAVELRDGTSDAVDGVAQLRGYAFQRAEQDGAHRVVNVVLVVAEGEQRIAGVVVSVGSAGTGSSDHRQRSVGIVEADECVLLEIVVVVGEVEAKAFAWRDGRRDTVVAIVSAEVDEGVAVGTVPEIDVGTENGPGFGRVIRHDAVTRLDARRDPNNGVVAALALPVEVEAHIHARPQPEADERRVLMHFNAVFIPGGEIENVVEDLVTVAEADAAAIVLGTVPHQITFIGRPALVEGQVVVDRLRAWRGGTHGSEQVAVARVVADPTGIGAGKTLRSAEGPEAERIHEFELLRDMERGAEIRDVGDSRGMRGTGKRFLPHS